MRGPIQGVVAGLVLAATGAHAVTVMAASPDAPKAGVAASVAQPVEVRGEPRPEPVRARQGMDMFLRDLVDTGSAARMQMLLRDETTFTVGPDTQVTINRFIYDPEANAGEVSAEMSEGIVRYISGAIGKDQTNDVEVATPAATVAVRGTALFVASVAEPDTYFAGLLGPGLDSNTPARPGGFTMRNEHGTTDIRRAGFGAYVTEGEAPGPPVQIPNELRTRLNEDLNTTDTTRGGVAAGTATGLMGEPPREAAKQDLAGSRDLLQRGRALTGAPGEVRRRAAVTESPAMPDGLTRPASGGIDALGEGVPSIPASLIANTVATQSTGGFSNVTARAPFDVRLFDAGNLEDGDVVRAVAKSQFDTLIDQAVTLTFQGTTKTLSPSAGPVELTLTALDEGAVPPTTGGVEIDSSLVQGDAVQSFNLDRGHSATLAITATR